MTWLSHTSFSHFPFVGTLQQSLMIALFFKSVAAMMFSVSFLKAMHVPRSRVALSVQHCDSENHFHLFQKGNIFFLVELHGILETRKVPIKCKF